MDITKLLMPSAASILQSMRDIGYNLDSAVADIIDNSIAAQATQIDLVFVLQPHPQFLIIDNGLGMSSDELYQALRFATKSPIDERSEEDLGRFGLGLKTASFSQARKLTVLSSKNNQLSAAQWDLDFVVENDQWLLKIVDPSNLDLDQSYLDMIKVHGTIVIWDEIDRIEYQKNGDINTNSLTENLAKLRDHLGLVFHKFIEGHAKSGKLLINLNHHPIQAFNPFCISNEFTQIIGTEKVFIENSEVKMIAYALPHFSNMTSQEFETLKKKSDLLNHQGAYVYRNDRLMVWGDWFRIIKKTENTKYARVEINFDKKIDHLWTIDIKKSKATPPYAVIDMLKKTIEKISGTSTKMHTKRVSKSLETGYSPWSRYSGDEIHYKVNTEFPLYQNLWTSLSNEQKSQFQSLIEILQSGLPMQSIYSDMAANPQHVVTYEVTELEHIQEKFKQFTELMNAKQMNKVTFKDAAKACGLFNQYIKYLDQWVEDYYA